MSSKGDIEKKYKKYKEKHIFTSRKELITPLPTIYERSHESKSLDSNDIIQIKRHSNKTNKSTEHNSKPRNTRNTIKKKYKKKIFTRIG